MKLPMERGPVSLQVKSLIKDGALYMPVEINLSTLFADDVDVINDDDLQLALYMAYELHYQSYEDARPDAEWNPVLLELRARLERRLLHSVRARIHPITLPDVEELPDFLFDMTKDAQFPLANFLAREATVTQFREFMIHKGLYHHKEADPYTWAIPRLSPMVKSAMIDIQMDEYGGGRPERMHQELFRKTMRELHLDDDYDAYVDQLPAVTLANVNLLTLFGLHRRYRGALCGHLAAQEMTSSLPSRYCANGLRRLGYGDQATDFFDEHVEADAIHEQLAVRNLCGRLVVEEPEQLPNIVFGVAANQEMDRLLGEWMLTAWKQGETSLRVSGPARTARIDLRVPTSRDWPTTSAP